MSGKIEDDQRILEIVNICTTWLNLKKFLETVREAKLLGNIIADD